MRNNGIMEGGHHKGGHHRGVSIMGVGILWVGGRGCGHLEDHWYHVV